MQKHSRSASTLEGCGDFTSDIAGFAQAADDDFSSVADNQIDGAQQVLVQFFRCGEDGMRICFHSPARGAEQAGFRRSFGVPSSHRRTVTRDPSTMAATFVKAHASGTLGKVAHRA